MFLNNFTENEASLSELKLYVRLNIVILRILKLEFMKEHLFKTEKPIGNCGFGHIYWRKP